MILLIITFFVLLISSLLDIVELFPGGIFDTKYIAEYIIREGASFLEYIFRKAQISCVCYT